MAKKARRTKSKCIAQENFLTILHWNVEGINSQIYGNKLENDHFLKPILVHDIIALIETQCYEEMPISVPGYLIWRSNRPKHHKATRCSGGITVCLKQHLGGMVNQLPSRSNDIMWLKLNGDMLNVKHDIVIGIVYISPNNSTYTKG